MEDRTTNQQSSLESSSKTIAVISGMSLGVGVFFWIFLISKFPHPDFVFRPLALLPLAAFIINLLLIVILYRKIQATETGFWFLAFLGTLAIWSLSEFMQRISATEHLAISWRLPAIFAWSIMPVLYLFFALSYVDKQYLIRRFYFQAGIFLVITGVVYAHFVTDLVISNQYFLKAWGYDSPNGPYLSIFGFWLTAIFLAALYLFIQEHKKTASVKKRNQIRIFVIGISVPLLGGVLSDIILPAFGHNVIPLAAFLTTVQGVVLGYGIRKHGIFSINPVILSGEIMKTLPQPVIVTDKNFDIQFMNANASEMFKTYYPFLGKNIKDLVGNENLKNILIEIKNIEKNKIANVDRLPLGLEGEVVIAQAKIRPIPEGDGYIFGLSNITQQVLSMRIVEREVRTRTQLYNQERARLFASVNGLRQGFLIVDDKNKINLMNKKAQIMFPDIRISKVQSGHVVDGSGPKALNKFFKDLDLNKEIRRSIENNKYVDIDGIEFNNLILDVEIIPIVVDNESIGAVILLDDVTEATLSDRSKDEFLSIASHELRTPLTAIRGNTSMMLNYYQDKIKDEELKEMVKDIHESSQRLIEIVNDFLDTSRLEQGRMEFNMQSVRLDQVINQIVKDTKAVALERGNTIVVNKNISNLPDAYADPDKLKQILYNLIGNSIKFTENGSIYINAIAEDNFAKVSIRDEGRGISEELQKLLFRKFQQAGTSILTRDATKGTGLGLYISKMLLDNMGGSIKLESSEVGKGSMFYFKIPLMRFADKKVPKITNPLNLTHK